MTEAWPDTPPISVYREYEQRKADLMEQHGPGEAYEHELRELVEELEI
jgi:hypothetical protein